LQPAIVIFGPGYASPSWEPEHFGFPTPLLLWPRSGWFRGQQHGVAAIACVSCGGAYRGDGSFARDSSYGESESMQLFWILLAVPLMPLAA